MEENNIGTAIFLFRTAATFLEEKRFGFKELRTHGVNVIVVNVAGLLWESSSITQGIEEKPDQIFIEKFEELDALVSKYSNQAVFMDFIEGLGDITWQTEKIYRILKKHQARVWIVEAGLLPSQSGWTSWREKIAKAFNVYKIFGFVFKHLTVFLSSLDMVYPKPEKVFCMPSSFLDSYIRRRRMNNNGIVPINSYDGDVYSLYILNNPSAAMPNSTCVFLDQFLCDHPDVAIVSDILLNPAPYYSSMKRFFDQIERLTGMEVVIAAHPRAQYVDTAEMFGERQIIKNDTVAAVAASSMVIAHFTTAVNFAVLFNKPLLLIKTAEMFQKAHYNFIDAMGRELGVIVVNIDDESAVKTLFHTFTDCSDWNGSNYDTYKNNYSLSPKTNHKCLWKIILEEMEMLCKSSVLRNRRN